MVWISDAQGRTVEDQLNIGLKGTTDLHCKYPNLCLCKFCIGKCEANVNEFLHFHNSGEYECEFCTLQQNSGLRNWHHNTIFTKVNATVQIPI
jgi:hypothetical protein